LFYFPFFQKNIVEVTLFYGKKLLSVWKDGIIPIYVRINDNPIYFWCFFSDSELNNVLEFKLSQKN